jgi:putative NIF3 family GTP cyclohydrolase 1 type 2
MISKPDLAPNHAIVFNRHTAADAGLRGYNDAFANVAVVTDMYLII